MKEVFYIDRLEQAEALLKPQRVEVLRQLAQPKSCTEVGTTLGQSTQRVYYHMKKLMDAGLVTLVSERRVRGVQEGVYQASAQSYWLSPHLVGRVGAREVQDELSLGYLLNLVEEVHDDVAKVDSGGMTLGVSGEIRVPAGKRKAFMDDLRITLQELFARHGGARGEALRLAVACYPKRKGNR